MKPSVFISRSLYRSKAFIDSLQSHTSKITTKSLIDFKKVKVEDLPKTGWLFFYSQTGVDFFLKQYPPSELSRLGLKVGVFGPKTGQHLESQGIIPDFVGTAVAETTFTQFSTQLTSNDQISFVRGKQSINSLDAYLSKTNQTEDLIIYDNEMKVDCRLEYHDILVFTSPMNVQAYFSSNPIIGDQTIIVIGSTTAITALAIGLDPITIARTPSMEGLAAAVLQHIRYLGS